MKFKIKLITFVILFCLILHQSAAFGQDAIPDLKGKWNGTAFLYADARGFSSIINKNITLDVTKQSGLDFSGNMEVNDKGVMRKLGFSGFINKKKRYICIITQGGDISIGYLITKNIMKIHLRSIGSGTEITIFRLIKEKRFSI